MPFFTSDRPSIQVGLVTAIAVGAGARADAMHLNVDLAAEIGADRYRVLCEHGDALLGEWLFAKAAFGTDAPDDEASYFETFEDALARSCTSLGCSIAWLTDLRDNVLPSYVERIADGTEWSSYDVLGLTTTFHQNAASLALAAAVRRRAPGIQIVFGGANTEGVMGETLMRAFPVIDHVVSGEAEEAFPALLSCIAQGEPATDIPGVVTRRDGRVVACPARSGFAELDAQPIPDYGDYFERLEASGLADDPKLGRILPFESARGCWWGEKHHCTFCGLNGGAMKFRSKTSERVLSELGALARRYRRTSFEAVDNILDQRFLQTLFRDVAGHRLDYTFFFEVKSNMRRSQLRTIRDGGVRVVQPGIESLSTHVLGLMDKGCTMLQNVRFLKWARYYDIRVVWNIIWGFPEETAEDYAGQLRVARLLGHLEPPTGIGPIRLERFSPYFDRPDRYGVSGIEAIEAYRHVYPKDVPVNDLAYFFDFEMRDVLGGDHDDLWDWVRAWREGWDAGKGRVLTYRSIEGGILIDDDRVGLPKGTHVFEDALAVLYKSCCETYRSPAQSREALAGSGWDGYGETDVRAALDAFVERGLMVSEDDLYLSLAVPAHRGL